MEFFEQQWTSYRAIVDHDLMEHRALTAAVAQVVDQWLAQRPAGAPAPGLVDLGCGDLALMAGHYRHWPLGSLLALDLTAGVLPLAEQQLGTVGYPCRFQQGDLLAWANQIDGEPVDLIHTAFAVHHLADDQKQSFLQGCRSRLRPGGLLLWADVFREPDESRGAYVGRYSQRIRSDWTVMTELQQEHTIAHLRSLDYPADRQAIETVARTAGFDCHWAWGGQHQAERLLVLNNHVPGDLL